VYGPNGNCSGGLSGLWGARSGLGWPGHSDRRPVPVREQPREDLLVHEVHAGAGGAQGARWRPGCRCGRIFISGSCVHVEKKPRAREADAPHRTSCTAVHPARCTLIGISDSSRRTAAPGRPPAHVPVLSLDSRSPSRTWTVIPAARSCSGTRPDTRPASLQRIDGLADLRPVHGHISPIPTLTSPSRCAPLIVWP
jgi:hypothetical protein